MPSSTNSVVVSCSFCCPTTVFHCCSWAQLELTTLLLPPREQIVIGPAVIKHTLPPVGSMTTLPPVGSMDSVCEVCPDCDRRSLEWRTVKIKFCALCGVQRERVCGEWHRVTGGVVVKKEEE